MESGTGLSLVKGPPGIECIRKKVIEAMSRIVRIAAANRFRKYFPITYPSC